MADKKATSAGAWSTRTWVPAGAPGPGDRVFADGKAITIDVDITCDSIHTEANAGIAAVQGGSFTCTTNRTITCNVFAGSTTCLTISGAAVVAFIGNATGGSITSATGISKTSSGVGTFIGNYTGGTATAAMGLILAAGDNNVTGNGYGGQGSSAIGIECTSTGVTRIFGNAHAPASGIGAGVRLNGAGTVYLDYAFSTTNVTSSSVVTSGTAGKLVLKKVEAASNGYIAAFGRILFENSNPSFVVIKENLSSVILTDVSEIAGQLPAQGDVRKGVSYLLGVRAGTLEVPPKAAVVIGVPTDDGVGTLNPTVDVSSLAADLIEEIMTSNDPLAKRWREVATVQSTGDQITAAT